VTIIVLMFLNEEFYFRLTLDEILVVLKTEVARQWGNVNAQRLEAEKLLRYLQLCHVKMKPSKYKTFPSVLPSDL